MNKGRFANFAQNRLPTFIKTSKEEVRIEKIHAIIMKIGRVDLEIIWLKLKKEINANKMYSPVSKCAERAK